MKQTLFIVGLLSLLITASCSEDFTVSAPYKPTTAVYGLLNPADSVHYIRIQKAFIDENKSAIELAKVPDSSFYNSLTVQLVEYSTDRSTVLNTQQLVKVNANDEGYQKNEPVTKSQQFFSDPNFAYKFFNSDMPLSYDKWYRLLITYTNGRTDSSNFIGIINDDKDKEDLGFHIPNFDFEYYQISFDRTLPSSRYKLLTYMPANARIIEGVIRFNYVDVNLLDNTQTDKFVDFFFDTETAAIEAGQSFDLEVPNSDIYAFLSAAIGPAPQNYVRDIDTCSIFVYAGSPELFYYNQINQGQAGGLTGDNIQPNYTNFVGDNVIGVVGSRAARTYDRVVISTNTIDSLKLNPATEQLRIRGRSDH